MNGLSELFQIDWRIFMAGTQAWLAGGSPYGRLSDEFSAGAFAYPPTALTWLALFTLLGPLGYYVWTLLQLGGWWALIKDERPSQILLLAWSPVILHLVEGQSTLPVVLLLWGALRAPRRGLLWGLAIAWALTKPQAALFPLLWLLWLDRASPTRYRLWAGIALGTLLLALPPTLRDPGIWGDWLASLPAYRERILQMAAWQGPSVALLALATYLWHRSGNGEWHWWATATLFPQTSYYALVALIPAMRLRLGPRVVAGLALAALLQLPPSEIILPWLLAAHALLAWLIAGGPGPAPTPAPLTPGPTPSRGKG
jgi:hypothetical protein